MMRTGLIAFGALLFVQDAAAYQMSASTEMWLGGERLSVSRDELRRLSDLGNALTATPAIQDRALAAARSVVNGPDARHVFASYLLEIGRRRQHDGWRAEALDLLIVSRLTRPEMLPGYFAARGGIALRAGDLELAASLWTRAAELQPGNPQALVNLAQVRQAQGDQEGAATLLRRAIAMGGQGQAPVPESWYRQWVTTAFNGRQAEQTAMAGRALVAAYPATANWRLALVTYRQLPTAQEGAEIDLLRLMRTARAFTQAAEYQRLAQLLLQAGLAAEALDTLEDGISRGIVQRDVSPTPEIGRQIARALGPPANRSPAPPAAQATGPLRRGTALAMAGRRAEAQAVLSALADDGSAPAWERDLARFWLLWLARPARPDHTSAAPARRAGVR